MTRNMKESRVEWIGRIPNEWDLVPLRFATININEKNNPIKMKNVLSLTNTRGVVPYQEKGNQGNISKEDLTQYKLAYKNTVIINSMNLKIGSVGLSKHEGCVSPIYYVLKNTEKTDIRFINYIFQSNFQKYLSRYGKGIMEIREKIPMYDVMHSYIPYPNLEEQERIADYLDRKVSKIDQIIEENKKIIELIEEYKKSFLDEIFYNGKNNKEKIKYLVEVRNEKATVTENDKYIGLENIERFTTKYIESTSNYVGAEGKIFKEGDLLISKLRPYLAKSYMAEFDGICTGEIEVIKKFNGNKKFLKYFTISNYYLEIVNGSTYGTKMPRASWDFIKNIQMPKLNMDEQKEIINKIERLFGKIEKNISFRTRIIQKLEEYKKSLIYEAVTGKVEVK